MTPWRWFIWFVLGPFTATTNQSKRSSMIILYFPNWGSLQYTFLLYYNSNVIFFYTWRRSPLASPPCDSQPGHWSNCNHHTEWVGLFDLYEDLLCSRMSKLLQWHIIPSRMPQLNTMKLPTWDGDPNATEKNNLWRNKSKDHVGAK